MQPPQDPVAEQIRRVYPYRVDLSNCDEEPLHHIQVIQSQTCLLAARLSDLVVCFVSDNAADRIGRPWEDVIDRPLQEVLDAETMGQLSIGLNRPDGFATLNPVLAKFVVQGERILKNLVIHRSGDYLVIEVEPALGNFHSTSFQLELGRAVQSIQSFGDFGTLLRETAPIIRRITGYSRVMIYRFDDQYNGEVVAESRSEHSPEPFLGLRYPHTDIPRQARELYLRNRIRIIGSVTDVPARLRASDGAEAPFLDLSLAHARGVSPVHLEYLGYMGVASTMSIAIVVDGKLWGLFALHHHESIFLDYNVRSFLLFIGQVFSGHLAIQAAGRYREEVLTQNMVRSVLGDQIQQTQDVFRGLIEGRYNLLSFLPATTGAALRFEGQTELLGTTPSEAQIAELVDWIRQQPDTEVVYSSDRLCGRFAAAQDYCSEAAGAMLIFLDTQRKNWIIWFRPEVAREIRWGGRPTKTILEQPDGGHRLSPRRSFAQYIERVEGSSRPWTQRDTDAVLTLRAHIKDSVLRQYTEVRQMNADLARAYEEMESFSYTVSHDLRAPLRAIDGYAEILVEDYADQLDSAARDLLVEIQSNVGLMNRFITDILELSRVGRSTLRVGTVNVPTLVRELLPRVSAAGPKGSPDIAVTFAEDFPPVRADERFLCQVYLNLLTNARKYGTPPPGGERTSVHVGYRAQEEGPLLLTVSNSGPPIPKEFHQSIFDIFSRATHVTGIEGTGVGLAIVRRIIERHQGEVWVEPDHTTGAKFVFYVQP